MVLLKLKHVYRSKDRQGRDRWLLRLPGRKAVTIKGAHGSPEFMASYQEAIEPVERVCVPKGGPGTIGALVPLFFGSDKFASKKPSTQRSRRSVLERFAESHGDKRVSKLLPCHVQAMVNAKGPNAGRHFLIALRLPDYPCRLSLGARGSVRLASVGRNQDHADHAAARSEEREDRAHVETAQGPRRQAEDQAL
jgi:hypothetical protein